MMDISTMLFSAIPMQGSGGSNALLAMIALGLSCFAAGLSLVCLSRASQRSKESGYGALKEKNEELTVRLDDLKARNTHKVTTLAKEIIQLQERLKVLEDAVAGGAGSRPLEFVTDADLTLEERMEIMEERMKTLGEKIRELPQEVLHEEPEPAEPDPEAVIKLSFEDELAAGADPTSLASALASSRTHFRNTLNEFFEGKDELGEQFYTELGKTLVGCNLGAHLAEKVCSILSERGPKLEKLSIGDVLLCLRHTVLDVMSSTKAEAFLNKEKGEQPRIIIVVGANDAEKTGVVGGIARQFIRQGARVLVGACDVAQEGATQHLINWCAESGIRVVAGFEGERPRKIAYKSVHKAQDDQYDVLLVDTVGGIAGDQELFNELTEVIKIIDREQPDSALEPLLVLDTSKGRQAFKYARALHSAVPLKALCLTQVHDNSEGGIAVALSGGLKVPICFLKTDQGENGLRVFSEEDYVDALLGEFETEMALPPGERPGAPTVC